MLSMEEPTVIVRWVTYLFASGDAGLLGLLVIALVACQIFSPASVGARRDKLCMSVVIFSVIFVACSSWPAPVWLMSISLVWVGYLINELRRHKMHNTSEQMAQGFLRRRMRWNFALLVVWIALVLWTELPFQRWPVLNDEPHSILVIGDSVTAGLNDGEDTWPRKLARQVSIDVIDASQPGATLKSAFEQNGRLTGRSGLVLLEIGGNDLLEGLPVQQFEGDLARLLKEVVHPDRTVVMLELPLPPFFQEYGAIQRRQAAMNHVQMIPKRNFARVLTGDGTTVDGIHLSDHGQTQMLEVIRRLLGKGAKQESGTYQNVSPYR